MNNNTTNNNNNNNNNNNVQYTMISQDDLERERLSLLNNNHHIKNLDRISCYSCSDNDSINYGDGGGCCGLSDSSSNSSDGQAIRTIKSIFYNNLFCKICLLLVCIIAIYTLIAIRCNGMGFDGCKQ